MNIGASRNFLLGIVFAVLWIGFNAGVSCLADTIPQLVTKTKPATVQIIAFDENWSSIKSGTGFFISSDGLIVTNHHVIQGAAHLAARTNEGATFKEGRLTYCRQAVPACFCSVKNAGQVKLDALFDKAVRLTYVGKPPRLAAECCLSQLSRLVELAI
jgi:hypothetical protein